MNKDFTLPHISLFLKSVIFLQYGTVVSIPFFLKRITRKRRGMSRLASVVALALMLFVSKAALAFETDTYDGWSVVLYGFSQHGTENKKNPYHEVNPGIGIQKHLGTCFFETANCYAGLSYIAENSVGGKTIIGNIGSKWTLYKNQEGLRFHVGATLDAVQYENPRIGKTYHGIAPIPFIGVGKGPVDLDLSIISKNPLKALTGKEDKAVLFLHMTYRF